ncbi:MAG: SH3 domain-containing protein [Fusobacteria bacterium]|nr:SH3 domain-containing protein [Fusobacteriota bacterium]
MKKFLLISVTSVVLSLSVFANVIVSGDAIPDVSILPQNANAYVTTSKPIVNQEEQEKYVQNYLTNYYRVWTQKTPTYSLNELNISYKSNRFISSPGVGENLSPYTSSTFQVIANETQTGTFGKLLKPAVVIRSTNLRLMPTILPQYSDADSTPFDNLQESGIYYGTPVVVIGETQDHSWYFVQTSSDSNAWIEASDIAFVTQQQIKQVMASKSYVIANLDNQPIMNQNGVVVTTTRFGNIYPVTSQDGLKWSILGWGKKTELGRAQIISMSIPKSAGDAFPLQMTQANVANMINLQLGQPYGWGDAFGYRDCSSTQRDLMAIFGIWLQRDTEKYNTVGQVFSLKNMTNQEKLSLISQMGKPFRTLLLMKGHVMLYIGNYEGRPVMFQQFWSSAVQEGDNWIYYNEKQSEISFVNSGVQNSLAQTSGILTAINSMIILGE